LADENGSMKALRRYSGETVVITLPDNKTIYDFDILGVWCEQYFVDFGHSRIPHSILVPPSPRMLGVKPEVLYQLPGSAPVQPPSSFPSALPAHPAPASPSSSSASSRSASLPVARVQPNANALLHSTVLNTARQASTAGPRRRPPQRRPSTTNQSNGKFATGSDEFKPKPSPTRNRPEVYEADPLPAVNGEFGARLSANRVRP
jgi:hypothetical protein